MAKHPPEKPFEKKPTLAPPLPASTSTPRAEIVSGGAPKNVRELVAGLGRIVSDATDGSVAVLIARHAQGIVWFRAVAGVLESMDEASRTWKKWSQ